MKKLLSKIARMLGVIAIVYACLVLYLVLSERRLAFPRAEIDTAAEDSLRQAGKVCHLDDGKALSGWILNENGSRTVIYFPAAGEDAATFLASAKRLDGNRLVGFNYRGSAGSEGRPGETHFIGDIRSIIACSGASDPILVGRGTGAIAAYDAYAEGLGKRAILIDPIESYGKALAFRYRIFFPEFLSRTRIRMEKMPVPREKAIVVFDDPAQDELVHNLLDARPSEFVAVKREGKSLLSLIKDILSEMGTN